MGFVNRTIILCGHASDASGVALAAEQAGQHKADHGSAANGNRRALAHEFACRIDHFINIGLLKRASQLAHFGGRIACEIAILRAKAIINALNDSQGRIREMMKHLMSELKKTSDAGIKTRSVSSVAEFDGESFLRDKTKDLSTYTRYLHNIIADEYAFIKHDLLLILSEAMYTTPPPLIEQTLKWCSLNARTAKGKELDDLIEMVIVHSFGYLQGNRTSTRETNDLVGFITRLRGVYTSSRSTDPHLLAIRALAQKIVTKATTIKNPSTIASVRTSLMLYLVLRAFTMSYYADR